MSAKPYTAAEVEGFRISCPQWVEHGGMAGDEARIHLRWLATLDQVERATIQRLGDERKVLALAVMAAHNSVIAPCDCPGGRVHLDQCECRVRGWRLVQVIDPAFQALSHAERAAALEALTPDAQKEERTP